MRLIIAGAGDMGVHLSKLLAGENFDCTLIDDDNERLADVGANCDVMTMVASPTSLRALSDAGAADSDLYIAVTPDETTNITSAAIAKALGARKTVARIDNFEYIDPTLPDVFPKLAWTP